MILPLLMAIASPGAQATPEPTAARAAAAATTEVESADSKIICRRERSVGSRLSAARVCQTAAEWERQRREAQQAAEKTQAARWKAN